MHFAPPEMDCSPASLESWRNSLPGSCARLPDCRCSILLPERAPCRAHWEFNPDGARLRGLAAYCNSPNTATLFWVPTNTLPSATVGVMNLLPAPN